MPASPPSHPSSGAPGHAATPASVRRKILARTRPRVDSASRLIAFLLLVGVVYLAPAPYARAAASGAPAPEPAPANAHAAAAGDSNGSGVSLQRGASAHTPGQAEFVRAPDATLYFSPHLLAPGVLSADRSSTPAAGEEVGTQLNALLDALAPRLAAVGSDLRHVLRLTVALADEADHARAAAVLAARFADHPPAVTWLGSPLSEPGARIAVEAIAASTQRVAITTPTPDGGALLPPGERIFISGQAERGADPASSVALTMASLLRSAAELGGSPVGVAQIRVFLRPYAARSDALAQITPLFPAGKCPPVIITEWTIPLPVEIELVLARNPGAPALEAPLVFPVLAGKPRSPRFSHAAIVGAGVPLIFLGGLDAGAAVEPADEWPALFARLGPVLGRAGSSFRLLVKATYLLKDESPRASLNETRAVYYDPVRPPAASAVGVRSVGIPGRAALLDLIAVPREAVPTTP